MTTQAQNIAIAESLGIKVEECTCKTEHRDAKTKRHLPDYRASLDAVHEAEKALSDEQRGQMMDAICEIVRRDHKPEVGPMTAIISAFFATAAQRAEAYLRTIGKWDDSK